LVVKGSKGHLPEKVHLDLLTQLQAILSKNSQTVFLGDGEFDGIELQAALQTKGWHYVCWTAKNSQLFEEGMPFSFDDLLLQMDDQICLPQVWFTKEGYGTVMVIARWKRGFTHPIYLVSNLELPDEAFYWYKKRFQIETFFSDEKSRGFFLHKSHLSDPQRLNNLMIAACLARDSWIKNLHRLDRCDWSLFRLGLVLLDHMLNELLPIPVSFNLLEKNCVR
jgi:hypothetical protein